MHSTCWEKYKLATSVYPHNNNNKNCSREHVHQHLRCQNKQLHIYLRVTEGHHHQQLNQLLYNVQILRYLVANA